MWTEANWDNSEMKLRIARVHKEMKEDEDETTK